ncbi:Transcription factor iws1 [Teratosphaeriaceae sp. CCFEE 6253]|nr:Transcription factor iws1 [Teratosphaeriaceae sp. CCFEE 6253]
MDDLELPPGSPALQDTNEPEALDDTQDPLHSDIDEEHSNDAPLGNPGANTEVYEGEDAGNPTRPAAAHDSDDDDSVLEELSEAEFEDFNPATLNIPDKPVAVDADNVGLLGVHKRKRTEAEQRERKKKKEGRRERPKKAKRVRAGGDDEEDFEGGPEIDGKRVRRAKGGAEGGQVRRAPRVRTPEDEETLTPEERRRRALDRKMDAALKSHRAPNRRRAGDSLADLADEEIASMRNRMAEACRLDAEARARGEIATHKLAVLPAVVELLNRNTIQPQLVDPDTNILEAVRFMLEPADQDAALPNYAIQKELFAVLGKLNIGIEALKASGVGKVVLFYTKSIQPQADIKRQAERLVADWMRVVLQKPKTNRLKPTQTATYDPLQAAARAMNPAAMTPEQRLAASREKQRKALAMPTPGNRARADGSGLPTYTVAPVNNMSNATLGQGAPRSGGGEAAVRRMVAGTLASRARGR